MDCRAVRRMISTKRLMAANSTAADKKPSPNPRGAGCCNSAPIRAPIPTSIRTNVRLASSGLHNVVNLKRGNDWYAKPITNRPTHPKIMAWAEAGKRERANSYFLRYRTSLSTESQEMSSISHESCMARAEVALRHPRRGTRLVPWRPRLQG